MKKTISFLFLALFTMTLAACGAPSPEDLCAKAEKKDECSKEMKELKEALGDDLWKEFAKCAKDKDFSKDNGKEALSCVTGDMTKKMMEAMEKKAKEAAPK